MKQIVIHRNEQQIKRLLTAIGKVWKVGRTKTKSLVVAS